MAEARGDPPPPAGWRLEVGAALLALSVLGPLALLPLVTAMGLSAATTATVSGAILAGGEALGIAAVAVMGRSGYAYLKHRLSGILRQYGPAQVVGRTRYTIGLVMFTLPLVFGFVSPYAAEVIPGYEGNRILLAVVGDLLLLIALFVLGGDFWDKLRALFVHDAKVVFDKAEVALRDATA